MSNHGLFRNEDLEAAVPLALRTGDSGLDQVAGQYHDAMKNMPPDVRRVAALLYLAHKGKLKDQDGRIEFTLTPAELRGWHKAATGATLGPNDAEVCIKALQEHGLAEFYTRRECRVVGELANAYRFGLHIFPVTADD